MSTHLTWHSVQLNFYHLFSSRPTPGLLSESLFRESFLFLLFYFVLVLYSLVSLSFSTSRNLLLYYTRLFLFFFFSFLSFFRYSFLYYHMILVCFVSAARLGAHRVKFDWGHGSVDPVSTIYLHHRLRTQQRPLYQKSTSLVSIYIKVLIVRK